MVLESNVPFNDQFKNKHQMITDDPTENLIGLWVDRQTIHTGYSQPTTLIPRNRWQINLGKYREKQVGRQVASKQAEQTLQRPVYVGTGVLSLNTVDTLKRSSCKVTAPSFSYTHTALHYFSM